jgi:glycerophosphoryl diester phosphodiesterase
MLDLKRGDHRLADRVAETIAARSAAARVTVCSRRWRLLERVERGAGVAIIHSVGSRRQLAALRRRFAGRRLHGVSIHRRLIDANTVADLRERAGLVLSWPVATPTEARQLAAWGVHGMISERYEALAAALGAGAAA